MYIKQTIKNRVLCVYMYPKAIINNASAEFLLYWLHFELQVRAASLYFSPFLAWQSVWQSS